MNDAMETTDPASPFAIARKAMVDSQLRTSGVNEPFVLARMGMVPREDFVPQEARGSAYIDRSVPLANGRRMAAPVFYGMLLAEAQPQLGDNVLIVDAGSGYLAALVEPLVASVDSITPEQALKAARGAQPVSLILVDGALEQVPPALAKRLHPDGRIVTGLVEGRITRIATGRQAGDGKSVALLPLGETAIPHLAEFDRAKAWSF